MKKYYDSDLCSWPSDSDITILRVKNKNREALKLAFRQDKTGKENELATLSDENEKEHNFSLINFVNVVGVETENASLKDGEESLIPMTSWDIETPRSSHIKMTPPTIFSIQQEINLESSYNISKHADTQTTQMPKMCSTHMSEKADFKLSPENNDLQYQHTPQHQSRRRMIVNFFRVMFRRCILLFSR